MNQIGELDPNAIVWRYFPFRRFEQFIQYRALWFSRLKAFEDLDEGTMPQRPREALQAQHRQMEDWFSDEERKSQVRAFANRNVSDGREMIVASCWYIEDNESASMWEQYGQDHEAVAVKSKVVDLAESLVKSLRDKWWIGQVGYVDLTTFEGMDAYQASQAALRAFLKGMKYSHERELRLATMNWVAPGCLNPDGTPPTDRQRAGYMFAADNPGVYVTADLGRMMHEVRTAPNASDAHHERVSAIVSSAGYGTPVLRSALNSR